MNNSSAPQSHDPTRPRQPERAQIDVALRPSVGSNGKMDMVGYHGRFAWYELLTTDMATARAFYGNVMGWSVKDASTPDLRYNLFAAGTAPVSGLMELPEEARRMGATPRWIGYVGVSDVDAIAERIKRLGGAVYVPPTDSNIGRISVVSDPQRATLALVDGLKSGWPQPDALAEPGRVGWHELLAADCKKAFVFYRELFGWRKANAEAGPADTSQLFSVGGQTIGCMFNKRPAEPVPFWLYYFNVDDIDAATERVTTGGGQIFEGPYEVLDGNWIVRCRDPQGAAFSLQGKRSGDAKGRSPAASELGWSTEWGGFSSRGRLLVNKVSNKSRKAEPEK